MGGAFWISVFHRVNRSSDAVVVGVIVWLRKLFLDFNLCLAAVLSNRRCLICLLLALNPAGDFPSDSGRGNSSKDVQVCGVGRLKTSSDEAACIIKTRV